MTKKFKSLLERMWRAVREQQRNQGKAEESENGNTKSEPSSLGRGANRGRDSREPEWTAAPELRESGVKPSIVTHTSNPNTGGAEAGGNLYKSKANISYVQLS